MLRVSRTAFWFAAIVAICPVGATAQAQRPVENKAAPAQLKVTVTPDQEYGKADGESLKLDLYLPLPLAEASAPLHPGVVLIHGGGWSGGDKAEYAAYGKELAERGYVAISVNYRLAPKHRFPANLLDLMQALHWLRQHSAEYHLDPERIGAMGSSAGGHLAALLGVSSSPEANRSDNVQCVVDYYGRMDLTLEPTGNVKWTDYRADYIGGKKEESLNSWQAASPINHVTAKTPPFLIVHGSIDQQVQLAQSEAMFDKLQKAGIESYLIVLAGQGHGFKGAPAQQAWEFSKSFLDRHLKK